MVTGLIGRRSAVELRRLRLVLMGCCWMLRMSGGVPGPRSIVAGQSCLLSCQASFSACCYSFPMNCSFLMSALDDSCGYDFCWMPMLNNSQARPGQARPGQARPGQARPGQARPSQAKPRQSVNWGRRLARSASRRPPVC